MFFGLTSEDIRAYRLKAALPLFVGLLTFTTFFLAFLAVTGRERLVVRETAETERLLTDYLQRGSTPSWFSQGRPVLEEQLGGLSFVRITRGRNRVLVADETISEVLFHELLRLDPFPEGAWRQFAAVGEERYWSIISRQLPGQVVIQVGRESSRSYRDYRMLLQVSLAAWGLVLPLSALTALWLVRRQAAPVVGLQNELEQLMAEGREQLLVESNGDTDRDRLCRQMNRLIRQNRRLVSEMQASLDNVAHDLRTPMARLRSVAEFGLREEQDVEKLRASLADCLEESERVDSMLRIMMSVAEAETGTIALDLERLELAVSIDEMMELYAYVAEERGITVDNRVAAGLMIRADRTRIAQVWANLLDNAIKYGRKGGWVEVTAAAGADRVEIGFKDNGMGISATEQSRIWERLYRGDRSRSRQGLGLGLNFVKAIVEAHGGTVRVDSVLHEGSLFTVTLPVVHSPGGGHGTPRLTEKSQTKGEWSESRTSGI